MMDFSEFGDLGIICRTDYDDEDEDEDETMPLRWSLEAWSPTLYKHGAANVACLGSPGRQ